MIYKENVKTVRSEQIRLLKFILENTLQHLKMQTANKAVLGRFPLAAFGFWKFGIGER